MAQLKRALPAIIVLLASPCWATWTLVQVKSNTTSTGSSGAVTVSSTGSSNLLVAGLISGANISISSVSAAACSSTWTHAANTNNFVTGSGSVDLYYCLSSASGQTSITITASGSAGAGSVWAIWEVSSTLGSIAVDSGTTASQHVSDGTCSACAGVALNLSGNSDFIAAIASCGNTCSGVTGAGFSNDLSNPSGDVVAHATLSTSGAVTAPATFTQPSSTLTGAAAAFQESSSGAVPVVLGKRTRYEKFE